MCCAAQQGSPLCPHVRCAYNMAGGGVCACACACAGEWAGDVAQGAGTWVYGNGDIYTGAFHAGRRHGQGAYHYATVRVFGAGWGGKTWDGEGKCGAVRG